MRLTDNISQTLTNIAYTLPETIGNTTNGITSPSSDSTDETALRFPISTCHCKAKG